MHPYRGEIHYVQSEAPSVRRISQPVSESSLDDYLD